MEEKILDKKKVRKKWQSKKASTKGRVDKNGNPIEFRLTFEEYYKLYNDFGQYPSLIYVLCRKEDLGHYEVGNVFVSFFMDNITYSMGKTTELDEKINRYCEKTSYNRKTVRNMIKRGELIL